MQHLAKIGFEKYFPYRMMKTGSSEPVYEKYLPKAIGITLVSSTTSEGGPKPLRPSNPRHLHDRETHHLCRCRLCQPH